MNLILPSVIKCFNSSNDLKDTTLIELVKLLTNMIKHIPQKVKYLIESEIFLRINPYLKLEKECSVELLYFILIFVTEILYYSDNDDEGKLISQKVVRTCLVLLSNEDDEKMKEALIFLLTNIASFDLNLLLDTMKDFPDFLLKINNLFMNGRQKVNYKQYNKFKH